jgi:ribosomal protein S12 methylthiotransferase accessory factor
MIGRRDDFPSYICFVFFISSSPMRTATPSTADSHGLFELMQPLGGLFGGSSHFRAQSDEPRLITRVTRLGNLEPVWGHAAPPHSKPSRAAVNGSGCGLDHAGSLLPAIAEGLERYCTCLYKEGQFITATAAELGREALDLDTVPRCSPAELGNPRCPLVAPDKNAPMRWVRGLSLLDGRQVYLPVVLVYLYAGFNGPGEKIALPITTGCAAHASYEQALLSGILEIVERDAISITWLQRLPLREIEIDFVSPLLAPYWEQYQRGSADLEYIFLDATSDLGIPTVYALQLSRGNKRLATLLACSTALDPSEAVVKVIKDMAACRISFRMRRPVPEKWEDFHDVFHGAAYMAPAERFECFEFLLQHRGEQRLSKMPSLAVTDPRKALQSVLEIFRQKNMECFAVDLSTDEALRAGVRVVRAIIPDLQPLSFVYRARYLGHPRLYEAPRNMGYPVYQEMELNRLPQPFA